MPKRTLFAGLLLALAVTAAAADQPPEEQPSPQQPGSGAATPAPPLAEAAANAASEVFGANLFTGAFARRGATPFNPDYTIMVGDRIQLHLWGGYEFDGILTVDAKGNIFVPNVGPVRVLGVRNEDLQQVIEGAVRRVYRANVYSYATLVEAQPVRIFVGGFVRRPGLYAGTSMDSLLYYLDQAGGIDPERGSFLAVEIKRGGTVRAKVNLYDFLLRGRIPLIQLAEGDVIFVPPRAHTVRVKGLAENAKRFEFGGETLRLDSLMRLAQPLPEATHVRIVRNTGTVRNVEYYPLGEAQNIFLHDGDEIEFTADKKPGTITVRVEGEHLSPQEYVLPYGTRLGELLRRVRLSPERSDIGAIQLFRRSVRERQKEMLETALESLEAAVLTARSGTSDEARLRKEEAELVLQWVERARRIEPLGQVLIARASNRDDILLENGDRIVIPKKSDVILVSGEVLFPTAVAFEPGWSWEDYIQAAGGFTQGADASRVVIARRDGSFLRVWDKKDLFDEADTIELHPGDEILVLPRIDVKSRQIAKDLTQIIYQIAVSAKVVLGL